MSYFHSNNKAKEFAGAALKSIEGRGLVPTPENYELWFVYHSGANPEIVRVVDLLIATESNITDAHCYEIYHKFLSGNRESDVVQSAGCQIQKTIQDVNVAVSSVRESTAAYNESLKITEEQLREEKTLEEINSLLSSVLSDTEEMIGRNTILEQMLDNSTKAMQDLQRDLEIARKEAMTDSLTGLSNRKSFDIELKRVSNEVLNGDCETFCLMLLDIDHFKNFNDSFGHQVGDQVLKLVAKTLKDGIKGRDVVARYGGEEFAILLPETGLGGGLKVAELLRQEVAKKEVVNRATGERIARITISAGVAEYIKTESLEELVAGADVALYSAKRNGRNQVAASSVMGSKKVVS